MRQAYDVVIAGAGVVGLTTAALLAGSAQSDRLNIVVIDAGSRPAFDIANDVGLRVSAIAPGSAQVFRSVGAWESVLSSRACAYREMRVWDAGGFADGPEALHFDAAEFAVPQLGHIVENLLLQDALLHSLQSSSCAVMFDTPLRELSRSGQRYCVVLGDGRELTADLVVGADGGASFVRAQAGIGASSWRYPQTAFVTHLRPQFEHRNIAWQRFLKSGPVALLPLADGRVSTVWSTSNDEAQLACNAADADLGRMLGDATDRVLGALTPAGPRAAFPLQAQHADKYVMPRLALIGDAAHSVHPLAGQGANLGIADAACLTSVVTDALAADEHPGDLRVLRRYERARRGANSTMLHFIDGIYRLFSTDAAAVGRLRGAGMALFNRSGALRRQAVRVALGIDGAGAA